MNARDFGALILGIALILAAAAAFGQSGPCHEWPAMRDHLEVVHGEKVIGGGLVSDEMIIAVLASPDGATFSIVAVDRNGIACLQGSGFEWDPGQLPKVEGKS